MTELTVLKEFSPGQHRHHVCIDAALDAAEKTCRQRGLRLTPTRRRVLELVWASHEPVKAYDLLAALQGERRRAAPPTVYRALEFLQTQGLVHRIESLNAYVGCGAPGHAETGQFLICKSCGEVAELDDPDLTRLLHRRAEGMGFSVADKIIEVMGSCAACCAAES